MNILIIIISLFLGVFVRPIFAQEEVKEFVIIDSVATEGVYIGQTFPVGISIVGVEPNAVFFYKFYGGIDNTISSIQTDPWLTNSSSWDKFPTVITDGDGNAYLNTTAYIDNNQPNGSYNLYVRLAYPDFYSPAEYKSLPQLISVLTLITSPTPTPTTALIPNPTETPSLTPTNYSNHNQVPTLTPTPTVNMKIFGTSIASVSGTTADDDYLIPTEASSSTIVEAGFNRVTTEEIEVLPKSKPITLIFAGLAFLFLTTPLIISKIKFKPKCLKK